MSAATADRDGKRSEGTLKSYPVVGSDIIYKDTLVGLDSDGYLVPLAHGTASLKPAGVAIEKKDNSAGSSGDISCRVRRTGEYEFTYNGGDAAQALVGSVVYALDDQTVDEDASLATNDYPVGRIVEVVSATKVRIDIGGFIDLTQTIVTANLADNILSADASGRAKMAADFFNAATVLLKFDADSIDNPNLVLLFADGVFAADATTRALFAARFLPYSKIALRDVEAHTADDVLTVAESGSVHTSVGAGGAVALTLPAAVVGLEYYFMVGAAQELRINPDGTETIALPSTGVQGAAGKYLTANLAGETVHIVCTKAGEWSVFGFTGTWTAEP